MKRNRIFFFFSIAILLFSHQHLSAQDYLVTVTGDTLKGTIKQLIYGDDKKVQVTDSQKKKTVVSIFKIRSFSVKGEIYKPVRTETAYEFMKLVKEGYLSLYAFIPEKQTSYDGEYLVKQDGKGMEVPNLSFKRMMVKFLEDCPVIAEKIDHGQLGKRDLDQIITDYNKCIDDKSHLNPMAATVKTTAWDTLEDKVKAHDDFDGKSNALEMITEIKNKVKKSEKVPNFLTEGLKNTLSLPEFKSDLDNALRETN